ncbi:hypothetical protein SAMN04487897_101910 [Paenibacillus sp. yr247]|nr:hypothetical protein SAMN04487897_101910 [Paenibacillus sp. yr247]
MKVGCAVFLAYPFFAHKDCEALSRDQNGTDSYFDISKEHTWKHIDFAKLVI